MAHHCHVYPCGKPVCRSKLMCIDHWRAVPAGLKLDVLKYYQPGQENRKVRPSKEWLQAARAAINAVQGK